MKLSTINAFKEMVELGLYRFKDGWARFVLPEQYQEFQKVIDQEQQKEWRWLYPPFPQKYKIAVEILTFEVQTKFVTLDNINNVQCIISSEPQNGSVEGIIPIAMTLPGAGDWLMCDTERREERGQWVPLNRRPQVIIPTSGPPIKFTFGPKGLDIDADIIFLEGKNLRTVNKKVESVIQALVDNSLLTYGLV